jgi:hypothetical protein
MNIAIKKLKNWISLELLFWIAALAYLALIDPTRHDQISLTPLTYLGIDFSPGQGLGRSISFLIHGDLASSWQSHWLGLPALGIILVRIVTLVRWANKKSRIYADGGRNGRHVQIAAGN